MRFDYTLDGFINSNSGNDYMSYSTFSIIQRIVDDDDTMDFSDICLIDDYKDIINDYVVEVKLDKKEQLKYHYNPGLLAYDVYGSVELEFVILKLNGIIDPKDFDMPVIKLITKDKLEELMTDIRNAENRFILNNKEELGDE